MIRTIRFFIRGKNSLESFRDGISRNEIYSLHEPDTLCISKGKAHKQYEFGRKASIAVTKTKGVIVGAMSFNENVYDGHTLPDVLEQRRAITKNCPSVAICERATEG